MGVGARLALAVVGTIALAHPASSAAVTLYGSSAPSVIRGAPPWTVTYTLELDAGPVDEQVAVYALGTLDRIWGPAKVLNAGEGVIDLIAPRGCDLVPFLPWQTDLSIHNIRLDLPAGTSSFVTMSRTRANFPAAADDLAFTFGVNTLAPDGTASDPLDVSLPGPAIALPRRPALELKSPDAPRFGANLRGDIVRISGSTDAALAGQLVELRYAHTLEGTGKTKLIARVPVRTDGSFHYRWVVPARGEYSVSARYRSHASRFVSTQSQCRLGFARPF